MRRSRRTTGSATSGVTLAVEGRSNENVSIAAEGNFVALTWSASTADATDIYSAVSVDGGQTFGPPVRVNSTASEARAGGEQPPRVALVPMTSGAPKIVVVWTARGGTGTRLLMSGSDDGGRRFSKTEEVPGGSASGNRGWESIAVDGNGRALALWLDHRNTASNLTPSMHQHGSTSASTAESKAGPAAPKPDPNEKAALSQLYFGSLDGSVPARGITGGVCYCCKTSLVASGQNVFAVWRHVFPGNQRDIAFAMSRDGGKTFGAIRRVSLDGWKFDGCPENGPAIGVSDDGVIHVAWVTPKDGKEGAPLALYTTTSRDGITFEMRKELKTDGAAAHVQATIAGDGSAVFVWDEATPKGRRIRRAREGTSFWPAATVDETDGVYPVVATTSRGVIAAWVRRGGPRTVIAVSRLFAR